MGRVALIGMNSVKYIEKLIDIWNDGDCAVLIDCQTPPQVVSVMLLEAQVYKCYIEQTYYNNLFGIIDENIKLIPYEREKNSAQLLPKDIYGRFKENYESNEAIIIYSSGTTGKSKGIILSHFAINTNADAIIDYMQPNESDCMYIVKNFTHSSTITGELLVALKTRTPILITPIIVPPRYILSNIVKYNVTIIGVNPLLLSMYCEECQNREYDLTLLKKIYVSGSILSDKIYLMAHEVFCNQKIYNVYGLSEAGPRVTAQRSDCCKSNSVGKVIKGVDVTIVNEKGVCLGNGELGVVHVNSPSIFNGYIYGELKHKSLYCNWLNTGDIGYFDEYDELHIIGRIDDMIVINGHKIFPSEVECHIESKFNIRECIVTLVNICDEDTLCCIYTSDNKISSVDNNMLSTVLMRYEIPKVFVKVDSIPRTMNGKVSMDDIKEVILQELE